MKKNKIYNKNNNFFLNLEIRKILIKKKENLKKKEKEKKMSII